MPGSFRYRTVSATLLEQGEKMLEKYQMSYYLMSQCFLNHCNLKCAQHGQRY